MVGDDSSQGGSSVTSEGTDFQSKNLANKNIENSGKPLNEESF